MVLGDFFLMLAAIGAGGAVGTAAGLVWGLVSRRRGCREFGFRAGDAPQAGQEGKAA